MTSDFRPEVVIWPFRACAVEICHIILIIYDHLDSLSNYARMITDACVSSTASTIRSTRPRGTRDNIPGWSEFVALLGDKSILWHNIWVDNGWPRDYYRDGIVANIMRTTRAQYHAAIRKVRHE